MYFEKLHINQQQIVNTAFLIALFTICSLFAISYTNNLQNKVEDSINLLLEKQSIFEEQMHILRTRHLLIRDIVATDDPFKKDELIQQHAVLATRFQQLRFKLYALPLSPEEISFLDEQIQKTRKGYNAQLDLIERSIKETKKDHYDELLTSVYPVTSKAYNNMRDYKKVMEDETRQVIATAHRNYENGWRTIFAIFILLVALLIAAFCLFSLKQRKLNQELRWKASHDNLTQLCNRAEFERVLSDNVKYRVRDAVTSILYLDLDEFKVVNDSCGHNAGDELLIEIAKILKSNVRKHDVVARLGGDEFGLLLMGCGQEEAVEAAELIRSKIHAYDFVWEGNTYKVGASIGVMEIDTSTSSIKEIMKRVDTVCYTAKSGGRNRVHVFSYDDEYTIRRIDEIDRADQIRAALRENRFMLYKQDFASLRPDLTDTCEILVRMLDGKGKVITPDKFIPAATRFHLMHEIDRWVIARTFEFLEANPDDDRIYNINLSAQTLNDDESREFIIESFHKYDIAASRICFEITEDSAIANLNKTVKLMDTLHRMGCHFALDDFGTGLSSFTYLQKLPVDTLKIDGSFIQHLHFDSYEYTFIEAMCSISKNLGIDIVGEWVETEDVLELLKVLGVDYAQGFLISEAMPLVPRQQTRAIAG